MSAASPQELVLVALGANLGDAKRTVVQAMNVLCTWSEGLRSSLWETEPEQCPEGSPMFVNAAVALLRKPEWTPEGFLERLHALEREHGRVSRIVKNESRTLDLDLIAFGSECRTGKLALPHPRAHERRFVLGPLAEIAPNFVWPGAAARGATVADLLGSLPLRPAP